MVCTIIAAASGRLRDIRLPLFPLCFKLATSRVWDTCFARNLRRPGGAEEERYRRRKSIIPGRKRGSIDETSTQTVERTLRL